MSSPPLALVWLHLVAGIIWFGGSAFLLMVVVPAGRHSMPLADRALYFRRLERRFDRIAWGALGILLSSGFAGLYGEGLGRRYLVLFVLKLVLTVVAALLRFARTARDGPRLARLAAEAMAEGLKPSAPLQGLWKRSVVLLALEVAVALPLAWMGLALARA